MKTTIMLLCALAGSPALAQPFPFTPAQQRSCLTEAQVFQYAASDRDSGMSPQQAFSSISMLKDVPKEPAKHIINMVYFDSNFAGAGGEALFNQVYEACLYPKSRFQPLK